MSVYDEMRAVLALDLKPNELKVWMTYRLEMDERARQVRGKSQAQLREVCGLNERQFKAGSSGLVEKGLIDVQRQHQAPQLVSVHVPNSNTPEIDMCRKSTRVENQPSKVSNFDKQEVSSFNTYTLYTAPVISAPSPSPTDSQSVDTREIDPNLIACKQALNGRTDHALALVSAADGVYATKARSAEWLADLISDFGADAVLGAIRFHDDCLAKGQTIRNLKPWLSKNAARRVENAKKAAEKPKTKRVMVRYDENGDPVYEDIPIRKIIGWQPGTGDPIYEGEVVHA